MTVKDGILVLNKPQEWTSSDCVALCRRALRCMPDGSFVPCVTLSGVSLGRAGRESVAEAWAALKARPELGRREYPDPGCASCRYSPVCRGVCRGLLDSETGGDWRYFCLRRHLESPWGGSL